MKSGVWRHSFFACVRKLDAMEKGEDQNPEEGQDQSASGNERKGKKHFTAAELDALTGSATSNVRSRRHHDTLSNTGTNISYEGTTPAGGAGSVGTGQNTTGARISTDSNMDHVKTTREDAKNEQDEDDGENENFTEQEESKK